MKKTIAFITTHIINKAVISEYVKLSKVSNCTCLLAVDNTNLEMKPEGSVTEKEFYGIKVKCFFFNKDIHNALSLPWFFENRKADRFSDVMWYNSEYRFYYIRKYFPGYDYYWQLEYDVFCNGESYQAFFDRYSGHNEDLLIAHLREEKADGEWYWSNNIKWKYDNSQIYGSLFPVVRMSGKAIDYLYQQRLVHGKIYEKLEDRKNAWWIFCELFVPTELIQRGFTAYCIDGQHLRFEPEYDLNEDRVFERLDNLLYHPVKGQFVEREKKLKNEKITLERELTELKGKLAKIQESSIGKASNNENKRSNAIKDGFVDISIIIPIYNVEEYLVSAH